MGASGRSDGLVESADRAQPAAGAQSQGPSPRTSSHGEPSTFSKEPTLSVSSGNSGQRRAEPDKDDEGRAPCGAQSSPSSPSRPRDRTDELQSQVNYLPARQVVVVFLGLSMALFISLLDQTIVSTALTSISTAFEAGQLASWLSTSYMLTSTAVQPMYGRMSDIWGRKKVLLVALAFFLVGSVLASAAQSMTQLIAFRAIAGCGGGGILTLSLVIISDIVSLRERGKYQGLMGIIISVANGTGPVIGGALAAINWRWCFIIAVPLTVISIVVVVMVLPLRPVEGDVRSKVKQVDYAGTVLTLVGSVLLLLGLNWGGQEYAWDSAQVLVTIVLGVVVMIAFCVVEWRFASIPIVPMHLFRNRTVAAVQIQTFLCGIVQYLLLFFVPQYAQTVKGYSGAKAGVTLVPLTAVQAVASTLYGLAVSRTGRYRNIILFGFTVFSIGVGLLQLLDLNTPLGEICGLLILTGIGSGGTAQTTLVAAQNACERKDLAVVTSLRNFLRLLGGTMGLSASFAILNNSVQRASRNGGVDPALVKRIIKDTSLIRSDPTISPEQRARLLDAYVQGFHNVFWFAFAGILLATLVTFVGVQEFSLDRDDDKKLKQEGKQFMASRQEKRQRKKKGDVASEASQGATDVEKGREG